MPVIKSKRAARAMQDAVVLDLGDLHRQGEQIIEAARAKAEALLDDARAREREMLATADERGHRDGLERGLREGREQGTAEGREAALAEMRADLERLVSGWSGALEQWESQREEFLRRAREDVLRLALVIAEKIVYRAVQVDPTIIEDQLAEAVSLIVRADDVSVRINPADRAAAESILPALVARLTSARHVELREDDAISRGGCVVRARGGTVDASIERQLERIAEALLPGQALDDDAPGGSPEHPGPSGEVHVHDEGPSDVDAAGDDAAGNAPNAEP